MSESPGADGRSGEERRQVHQTQAAGQAASGTYGSV